jgi:hypothetical protein
VQRIAQDLHPNRRTHQRKEKATIKMVDDYIDSDGEVSKKRPNPTHDIVDQITSKAYQKPHAWCSASGVEADEDKCELDDDNYALN